MSATSIPSPSLYRGAGERPEVLWIGFNQDFTSFSVGTDSGFSIMDVDPLRARVSRDPFHPNAGGIGIVEQLFRTNIFALVGGGSNPKWPNNKVVIWDDHAGKKDGELELHHPIRAVRLKRDRIFIASETMLVVYNFQDLSVLLRVDTFLNPRGILAVSGAHPVFACPGSHIGSFSLNRGAADAALWPHTSAAPPSLLYTKERAADHPLTCLALSPDGNLVATGSEQGTIVRVWSTLDAGAAPLEFRRGTEVSPITALVFSPDASLLLVASEKPTIHLFSLTDRVNNTPSSLSYFGGFFGSNWSCAQFKPTTVSPKRVCFSADGLSVLVIATDGSYWKQSFKINHDTKTITVLPAIEEAFFLHSRQLSTGTI